MHSDMSLLFPVKFNRNQAAEAFGKFQSKATGGETGLILAKSTIVVKSGTLIRQVFRRRSPFGPLLSDESERIFRASSFFDPEFIPFRYSCRLCHKTGNSIICTHENSSSLGTRLFPR